MAKKAAVSVLIAALMLFCVGDVVHAFMPGSGQSAGCDGAFCNDRAGCGTVATFTPSAPPIVSLETPVAIAPPRDLVSHVPRVEWFFFDLRAAVPFAPRSPPSA
jgi:hypothetical protein